jgi:4'-phosphopantetheinyl transferase
MRHLGRIDGADLWLLDLGPPAQLLASSWPLLSPGERARALAIPAPKVRARAVAARAGLRRLLAAYLDRPPEGLDLRGGPGQKPWLPGGPAFSLSHGGGLGLCAVSTAGAVGVDLEPLRPVPDADGLARRYLPEVEDREHVAAAGRAGTAGGAASRDEAFLRGWTRREAYLKALGVGLVEAGGAPPRDAARWALHDLEPAEGYLGALVVERRAGVATALAHHPEAG